MIQLIPKNIFSDNNLSIGLRDVLNNNYDENKIGITEVFIKV